MSGIGEIQTVSAIFDLLKVAYQAGKFLKKVKDADKIALELGDRISRLSHVLDGVSAVLRARDEANEPESDLEAQVTSRIRESIVLCGEVLETLSKKLGGFRLPEQPEQQRSLSDRVKVALRQRSIVRINNDLEARIHILSTDLSVLQLFEQTRTKQILGDNHEQLMRLLADLGSQVSDGTNLLKQLVRENAAHRRRRASSAEKSDEAIDTFDRETIDSLAECLRDAEDVHERYTSEYQPDDRSIRLQAIIEQDAVVSPMIEAPSEAITSRSSSPARDPIPAIVFPDPEYEQDDDGLELDEDDDHWPLDIINMHISGYVDHSNRQVELGHYNQAESSLAEAIKCSEQREIHHNVPFANRAQMQEDLAILYQKQQKWAEAVALIHNLLRDLSAAGPDGSSVAENNIAAARLNQNLASIYYDRHLMNSGAALSLTQQDVAKAELHARRAFNKRWNQSGDNDRGDDDADKQACIQLLVKILETRDKTVESNALRKLLSDSSSSTADSIRRVSTAASRLPAEYDMVDKHDILIAAIKAGDFDQIENLLASRDLDLERLCKDGKTPLMHAIDAGDEFTVHKLLDPEIGANLETKDKRGRTALHYAAEKSHEMVKRLLNHDAELEPRDRYLETPIIKAVKAGNENAVQMIYEAKASTLDVKSTDEWSLLHHAAHSPHSKMTIFLLDIHPELKNAVDRAGKTALHHCAEAGKLEQAIVLLKHKHHPDVEATDSCTRTPLYLAATKPGSVPERVKMVELLVKHGAVLNPERPPPRMRDYAVLMKQRPPRRDSALSKTSVSTSGTVSTGTTGLSRFSKALGGRMGLRSP